MSAHSFPGSLVWGYFVTRGPAGNECVRCSHYVIILPYFSGFQSVILPVHNAEPWLDACLRSVLQQDFEGSMELSVFNDASKVLKNFPLTVPLQVTSDCSDGSFLTCQYLLAFRTSLWLSLKNGK